MAYSQPRVAQCEACLARTDRRSHVPAWPDVLRLNDSTIAHRAAPSATAPRRARQRHGGSGRCPSPCDVEVLQARLTSTSRVSDDLTCERRRTASGTYAVLMFSVLVLPSVSSVCVRLCRGRLSQRGLCSVPCVPGPGPVPCSCAWCSCVFRVFVGVPAGRSDNCQLASYRYRFSILAAGVVLGSNNPILDSESSSHQSCRWMPAVASLLLGLARHL